jgi:hypothetical protein
MLFVVAALLSACHDRHQTAPNALASRTLIVKNARPDTITSMTETECSAATVDTANRLGIRESILPTATRPFTIDRDCVDLAFHVGSAAVDSRPHVALLAGDTLVVVLKK